MSQTTSRNRVLLLVLAVLALSVLDAAPAAPALASSPAARAAVAPAPSTRPGYWADTSCSENGEPASSAGWQPPLASPYPLLDGVSDDCLYAGGSLGLRDEGSKDSTPYSGPAWIYEAVGDSVIVGGFADLTMQSPGGEASLSIRNGHAEWTSLASCDELCTTLHAATATIPSGEYWILTAEARCTAPAGKTACTTSGVNAELSITRATLLQRNTSTPGAGAVTGTLTESPVSGTADIAFEASDPKGPGVYRVVVELDGKEVVSETPNVNEENCVAHGTYDEALNFRSSQPCPQETAVRIEVPTAEITNGPHLVEAIVEDAAGHRSVVYDKRVDFQNGAGSEPPPTSGPSSSPPPPSTTPSPPARGPANGDPASENATLTAHWNNTSTSRLTSSYRRPQKITGRLTSAAGTPISGALIEVTETPASLGAIASPLTSTHTSPDGTFTVGLAADASSTIQLAYRSHLGDAQPAASTALTLQVPASLHLTVAPHVTSVGETIVLSGTLAGTIPPGGKQLVLEGRAPHEPWVEFETVATEPNGHFKAKHRFRLPGPMHYQFRVISKREASFPYLKNSSNVVAVFER